MAISIRVNKRGRTEDFDVKLSELKNSMAKLFYDTIKSNISNNKFGFSSGASKVDSRKKGTTPMVDSGEYLGSIVHEGNRVYLKGGNHSSGISFDELSDLLEYGRRDKSFNGYPVWRLTLKELQPTLQKMVNDFLQKQILLL